MTVALLTEGVDRNGVYHALGFDAGIVALLTEGVDRNIVFGCALCIDFASPSSRRAWIEITLVGSPK